VVRSGEIEPAERVLQYYCCSALAVEVQVAYIELVLCLNSKSCSYAYEIAKKCDFSLSGIIPGAENGDYIIMQMLLGDKMDYDKLVLVGEFEELRNDIVDISGYDRKEK